MTREGARQPGAETRSVEKVEKLIACNGQVQPWSCYLVAFHRETQGTFSTFSTLLVPFRNVISERRTLQNKSGEIYRQKKWKVEKVEKLKSGEKVFVKSGEIYIYDIFQLSGSKIERPLTLFCFLLERK